MDAAICSVGINILTIDINGRIFKILKLNIYIRLIVKQH